MDMQIDGWMAVSKELLYGNRMRGKTIVRKEEKRTEVKLGGAVMPSKIFAQWSPDVRVNKFEMSNLMAVTSAFIPPPRIDVNCQVVDRHSKPRWRSVKYMGLEQLCRSSLEQKSRSNRTKRRKTNLRCYSFSDALTIRDSFRGPQTDHVAM